MRLYVLSCFLALTCVAADPLLPDPKLTPGETTNVPITILVQHGYTSKVRNVSQHIHREVFIRYFGKVPDHPGNYKVDHLISLELGGCNSVSNLWPQSYLTVPFNARVKDKLENYYARRVRSEYETNGTTAAEVMLHEFQHEIAENWTNAYVKHLGKP